MTSESLLSRDIGRSQITGALFCPARCRACRSRSSWRDRSRSFRRPARFNSLRCALRHSARPHSRCFARRGPNVQRHWVQRCFVDIAHYGPSHDRFAPLPSQAPGKVDDQRTEFDTAMPTVNKSMPTSDWTLCVWSRRAGRAHRRHRRHRAGPRRSRMSPALATDRSHRCRCRAPVTWLRRSSRRR